MAVMMVSMRSGVVNSSGRSNLPKRLSMLPQWGVTTKKLLTGTPSCTLSRSEKSRLPCRLWYTWSREMAASSGNAGNVPGRQTVDQQ